MSTKETRLIAQGRGWLDVMQNRRNEDHLRRRAATDRIMNYCGYDPSPIRDNFYALESREVRNYHYNMIARFTGGNYDEERLGYQEDYIYGRDEDFNHIHNMHEYVNLKMELGKLGHYAVSIADAKYRQRTSKYMQKGKEQYENRRLTPNSIKYLYRHDSVAFPNHSKMLDVFENENEAIRFYQQEKSIRANIRLHKLAQKQGVPGPNQILYNYDLNINTVYQAMEYIYESRAKPGEEANYVINYIMKDVFETDFEPVNFANYYKDMLQSGYKTLHDLMYSNYLKEGEEGKTVKDWYKWYEPVDASRNMDDFQE